MSQHCLANWDGFICNGRGVYIFYTQNQLADRQHVLRPLLDFDDEKADQDGPSPVNAGSQDTPAAQPPVEVSEEEDHARKSDFREAEGDRFADDAKQPQSEEEYWDQGCAHYPGLLDKDTPPFAPGCDSPDP